MRKRKRRRGGCERHDKVNILVGWSWTLWCAECGAVWDDGRWRRPRIRPTTPEDPADDPVIGYLK